MEDRRLLERRDGDLSGHVARIANEFLEGFTAVERIGRPGVTVFGSARVDEEHPAYRPARDHCEFPHGGYFVMRPTIFDYLRDGEEMVPHAFARLVPERRLFAQRYTGFWRAALRAGSTQARMAATANAVGAAAKVSGSRAPTWNNSDSSTRVIANAPPRPIATPPPMR